MFILSGVGARLYYRSLGYRLENNYMYQDLSVR
jgi:histone acetyltransferase (RNA polymerase elongator complex component)